MRQIKSRFQRNILLAIILCLFGGSLAHAQEDDTFGSWSMGSPAPGSKLATHSTLLRNNKILVVSGSSYNCTYAWGKEDTRLYDIATNTWGGLFASPAPYGSSFDAFCSAHVHDNIGGIVFQGGLVSYANNGHGINNSARYDPVSGAFTQLTGLAEHWYPTMVAGVTEMYIFPGLNTQPTTKNPEGNTVERMAYGGTSWVTTGASMDTVSTYPRVTFLPSGKLFVASPAAMDRKNYFFNPATNTFSPAGNDVVPESEPGQAHGGDSWQGTGVLLPFVPSSGGYLHAQFALINGVQYWIKDLAQANPTWQVMGTRPSQVGSAQRWFGNSTLLPTGQIAVTGGVGPDRQDSSAVTKPEIYDPETNSWLLTSAATVPRNYHGVTVLMPDGRLWTGSGSKNHCGSDCGCTPANENETRVEIFTPWYYGRSDRPVVTSCPSSMVANGTPYNIGIGGSQGTNIGRVVMIRAGSVTHSFDTDQRLIQLDILGKNSSTVTVASPYTPSVAIPGDYMVFALRQVATSGFKKWVPSRACWTQVATPAASGAPIWRYTGPPCSGNNCPGWQKLDNNPKTIAIATSGGHHSQSLYQLHKDGWIWRYTDTPCQGDSCPGWLRLDDNSKTIAIVADGNQLYQLHNDGWIWRYTGTPCSGDNCPGWQRLDDNSKTIAITASNGNLYQLHNDGWIWRYTGTPCSGDNCPGWQRLDKNSKTVGIAAAGNHLYQLHNDGWIWRYTGTPCSGDNCPGWERLDDNPATVAIAAAGDQLYQLHNNGEIWHFLGTPCSGDSCPSWEKLDNNSKAVAISATATGLLQLHVDGLIWRYTGSPCSGNSCPGWQMLDDNSRTAMIAGSDVSMPGAGDSIYQLHTDPVYQLHNDGSIWRYTGVECNGDSCPGWERLDNNPVTDNIVVSGSQLFQHHSDGTIWRYTGTPCNGNSCPSWQMLDNNPSTKAIAAAGNQLFQLHNTGKIWRYTGTPCNGSSCTSWQMLDNNPNARAIAAAGNQLFELHNDGKIWRYTGTPCNGNSCPNWQMLDNNPGAVAIASGGAALYQLHNDGSIWRYTGTPCSGTGCPGWQRLDNNTATSEIVATGDRLYQRHNDGSIWRYTGPPCSGDSCPGWRRLDNNPNTTHIATENQTQ